MSQSILCRRLSILNLTVSCFDMISCTLLLSPSCFVCCSPLDCLAVPGTPRSIPRRCRIPTQKCSLAIPSSLHSQFFFPVFFPRTRFVLGNTISAVHRRSDEPFWRKVPSRMTGNSSKFTDANRRESVSRAQTLWPRCRSRDDDRSGNWGSQLITELADETSAWLARRPQSCRC